MLAAGEDIQDNFSVYLIDELDWTALDISLTGISEESGYLDNKNPAYIIQPVLWFIFRAKSHAISHRANEVLAFLLSLFGSSDLSL